MKFFSLVLTVGLYGLVWPTYVTAAPMYYTFEGSVTQIHDSTGSIMADYGTEFGIGSEVSYTFLIDKDLQGYYTYYNGRIENWVDSSDRYGTRDYFYTDYISGPTVSIEDVGLYDGPDNVQEYNLGYFHDDTTDIWGDIHDYTVILGGPNYMSISSKAAIDEWLVGTTGYNSFARDISADGSVDIFYSRLELTYIGDAAPVAPVPEPSTIVLLVSGLAGLAFWRRRQA